MTANTPIFPLTRAGVAAFRKWCKQQRAAKRQSEVELKALARVRGLDTAWLGNASDDAHLAHECLIDDLREVDKNPSPTAFFRAQALERAIVDLEHQLLEVERKRLMALPVVKRP